jgi:hypothetical protein
MKTAGALVGAAIAAVVVRSTRTVYESVEFAAEIMRAARARIASEDRILESKDKCWLVDSRIRDWRLNHYKDSSDVSIYILV